MASELLIRSPAADLYARALVMAYKSGIRIYDPSMAQAREPDIEAKLLRDADIAMVVKLRQHMIAGQQWVIEPADDKPVNKEAAKIMRSLVLKIRGFTQARHNLARAFLSGQRFASMEGAEMALPLGDGQVRTWNCVLRLRDHDKRRFRWAPDQEPAEGHTFSTSLEVLSTRTGEWEPVRNPDWLIKHTYDDSEEMLGYGRGLREALYWWWYAKENLFRESLQAAERFGQGIITAKIAGAKDANGMPNTELVAAWKRALDAMRAAHIIVYDKDDEVEVVQMNGTGWQLMSTLREEMRDTIRALVLGANSTTNNEGRGGSQALASVQENSTESLVGYDRETLEETLTEDLIGYLWKANFHNLQEMGLGGAEMPRFKIKQERQSDPDAFGKSLTAALSNNMPVLATEAYSGLGLSQPKEGDAVILPQAPPAAPPGFPGGGGQPPGQPGLPAGAPAGQRPTPPGGENQPGDVVPALDLLPSLDLLPTGFQRGFATFGRLPGQRTSGDPWPFDHHHDQE